MNIRKCFRSPTICFALLPIVALSGEQSALADPVAGEILTLRQPDGTTLQVRVWGDEFYHVAETLDGYTVVAAPDGRGAHYAKLSDDGDDLVSTGVAVGDPIPAALGLPKHLRIRASAVVAKVAAVRTRFAQTDAQVLAAAGVTAAPAGPPNLGSVKGIVLLVDFSDDPATIAASAIDNYCNQIGYTGYGNNGSVRDYFYDVSEGLLTYTNFVPTAYHRASRPRSYYEDLNISFGVRARELMLEALTALNDTGFDFSLYDSNADGLVDAINMFYAGQRGAVWAEGLWPHSSSISFNADGVSTFRYQMTNIGSSLALGTFCHENGHMICYWPDLYDYGYESTGAGEYCLMAYGGGGTNPAHPCAYMKYVAGWANTTLLSAPQTGLAAPLSGNVVFKFNNPTKSYEYYLIENRQKVGRDSGLPDAGLAIWHIDELGSNNNEQMTPSQHYKVTVVQADGRWDLERGVNYGDTTDLWAAPDYREIGPGTTPSTPWWNGASSGLLITQISANSANMTFNFGVGSDCNGNGVPDVDDIAGATSSDVNGNGVPDECECPARSSPAVAADPMFAKPRFLTIAPGNAGAQTALRVTVLQLPGSDQSLVGASMWVGPPQSISENSGKVDPVDAPGSPTFEAATLQCTAYYADWGAFPTLQVYHELIVPDGVYDLRTIDQTCFVGASTNYSAAMTLGTSRWSDLVSDCTTVPCGPPDGIVNVTTDIVAILDKFANKPNAVTKARCDVGPARPDLVIDVLDLTQALDAFGGTTYPYAMPAPCG